MGRLIAAAFMGIVILAECAIAYVFVPGPSDMQSKAVELAKDEIEKEADEEEEKKKKEEKTEEVELGKFNIAWHVSAADNTLRADFTLIGIVQSKKRGKFDGVFENNKGRMQGLIIAEFRNSTADDLNDSRLGLIKRRILEKSNALLGEPYLVDLAFSSYSFVTE